jgi:multiple sugar transport system substrate-binding protein
MNTSVTLTGMTWNHSRGLLPMLSTAQRFAETHGVEITWEKRSLQKFADAPLADLAARFDLLVIDHPSIGEAAQQELLIPLEEHLPAEFIADQAANSVGGSHASYLYGGHLYALAIDAATPIAGWRQDLLDRAEAELPQTWNDLLALARRGLVTVPAIPIDSLMNVFMLLNALDAEPFSTPGRVAPTREAGREALRMLRELVSLAAPGSLERNPIRTWQLLVASDDVAYCPFAYGYSNYSRVGYAQYTLTTGGLISVNGKPLRSTLGGAGLAISRYCRNLQAAIAYAQFVSAPMTQRTLYGFSGGQPGHRAAWTDDALNAHTHNFFRNTLLTLDSAWVRPRFPGFIAFQDEASITVHRYLVEGGSEDAVLDAMDASLRRHHTTGAAA